MDFEPEAKSASRKKPLVIFQETESWLRQKKCGGDNSLATLWEGNSIANYLCLGGGIFSGTNYN